MPFLPDFPPPKEILHMEPEELAPFVLRHLQKQQPGTLNRYNFTLQNDRELSEALGRDYERYAKRLMEAWVWLEREGLVAPMPGQNDTWMYVTERGSKIVTAENFAAYRQASLFPGHFDPVLVRMVRPLFLRGDYETAVFRALKEVEVRVRAKGIFTNDDFGVDLMKKAFGPNGPLTDKNAPKAEQDRVRELFTGALGAFKNPTSHREVRFDNPAEVIDVLSLANQLLRIVDRA